MELQHCCNGWYYNSQAVVTHSSCVFIVGLMGKRKSGKKVVGIAKNNERI